MARPLEQLHHSPQSPYGPHRCKDSPSLVRLSYPRPTMTGLRFENKMGESMTPIPSNYRFLYKAIPGVKNRGCSLEVWFPKDTGKGAHPLAIMIHGGGWMLGSLDSLPFNQVKYLLDHGVAVASVEYRLAPHASLDDIREDLLDCYAYIQRQLNTDVFEAGGLSLVDGSRCCVFGWSAGAGNAVHLACDVVKRPELPRLRAVVPTYILADFDLFNAPMSEFQKQCEWNAVIAEAKRDVDRQACGVSFRSNPHFSFTSLKVDELRLEDIKIGTHEDQELGSLKITPKLLLFASHVVTRTLSAAVLGQEPPFDHRHSPIHIVTSDFPPTCVVAATHDSLIPPGQSRDFHAKLLALGVESIMVECEGMEHGEAECLPPNEARWVGDWWGQAIKPSLDFAIEKLRTH